MKKNNIKLVLLTLLSLVLVACQSPADQGEEGEEAEEVAVLESTTSSDSGPSRSVTELSTLDGSYYRPLLRDGQYRVSQSRGVTRRLNSNINLKSFEKGLMGVAQNYFSTNNHLFEEGQYIPRQVIYEWLGRESQDNPHGLNPRDNGQDEPGQRAPIYLESILEHDYYVEADGGPRLAGIVIGLGMNSVDYYQKEQFGPVFEDPILRAEVQAQAQEMANAIAQRIRQQDHLKDVPLIFGVYEQSAQDDIAGGVYIMQGQASGDQVQEWHLIDHSKAVLPHENENSNVGQSFQNFRSEIENFFPNLSGVTGVVEYQGETVSRLVIEINANVYGEGEMIALSQYVQNKAETTLPSDVPLEITIRSLNGVEAFFYSGPGEPVRGHIFN